MLNHFLYWILRSIVFLLQLLPLGLIAGFGRCIGLIVFHLDERHRKVALQNLHSCFPEKDLTEIRTIARENFCRIGENFASAIKTSTMPIEKVLRYAKVEGVEKLLQPSPAKSRVVAIGHFGNFELYARLASVLPGFQGAATFRGLDNPALNRLMATLRSKSGCLFFDRRSDVKVLRQLMNDRPMVLGLLADQHGGDSGLIIPFFGYPASTNAAPAVLALRYKTPLFMAFCFRESFARWKIQVGEEINLYNGSEPRTITDIMIDVNNALEQAVRRDPANWFWVHNRWKTDKERFLRKERVQ